MNASQTVESLVSEYAENKAQADRLTARNAEIAELLQAEATFSPGSDTGHISTLAYKVSITRRINERWDQDKLEDVRSEMTDDLFFTLFKSKYEPDRKALKVFMQGNHDSKLRCALLGACTASAGRPSVKLTPVQQEVA